MPTHVCDCQGAGRFHHAALHVHHARARLAVVALLAQLNRLDPPAVARGAQVVEVGRLHQAPVAEGNLAVRVEQVGAVLVHEVADAQVPHALESLGRVVEVPRQIDVDFFDVVIEVGVARVGAVVRDARQRPLLVAAVADGEPLVAHREVFAHAEAQAVLDGRAAEFADDVAARPHAD